MSSPSPQPPALEPAAFPHTAVEAALAPKEAVIIDPSTGAPKIDPATGKPLVKKEQNIDPWNVEGAIGEDGTVQAIDYTKLIEQFGTRPITDDLLQRFEKLTGHRPHILLRRGMFFSHRDLARILDRYEAGKPFFLYTGRGPSSDSMHLGHMIPFQFTK